MWSEWEERCAELENTNNEMEMKVQEIESKNKEL